jgi:DNA-binding CsgD family transcriptional regulator
MIPAMKIALSDRPVLRRRSYPAAAFQPMRLLGLTRRECEVMRWVCDGKTDAEIGMILGISRRTVNHHVAHLLAKLGAENRTIAATLAHDYVVSPEAFRNGHGAVKDGASGTDAT